MERHWIVIGALMAGLSVGLGAFGAHALRATLEANGRMETFQTAVQYHIAHALALILVGLLSAQVASPMLGWAGGLLTAGIVLFSGSLYVLAIFNVRWMGAIAPLGGVAFLMGWACVAWAAAQG